MNNFYHKNGVVTIRKDDDAMYIYLPRSNHIFFAPTEEFDILVAWYKSSQKGKPPLGYEILNKKTYLEVLDQHKQTQYLGNPEYIWETIPLPTKPLLLNWMITEKCNHQCLYCYAQDLMQCKYDITKETVYEIVANIKQYNPLVVVITGGEPTLSPYFEIAIEQLAQFTSVIVDTNGTLLNEQQIVTIQKFSCYVRISLDSHRPQINIKTRIAKNKKETADLLDQTIQTISKVSNIGVPITIHTVATTKNYDDIPSLIEALPNFKINEVSIRTLQNSKDIDSYEKLRGEKTRFLRFYEYIAKHNSLPIRVRLNLSEIRNSVIIVAPDGVFYTESTYLEKGKIAIDGKTPYAPSLDEIRKKVDMHAHAVRYINK